MMTGSVGVKDKIKEVAGLRRRMLDLNARNDAQLELCEQQSQP